MYLVWVDTGDGRMGVITGNTGAAERMREAMSSAFSRETDVIGPLERSTLLRLAQEKEVTIYDRPRT